MGLKSRRGLVRGRKRRRDHDMDATAAPGPPTVCDQARSFGKEGVIGASSDVVPWEKLRAPLTDEDGASHDLLAAKTFYAEALTRRITTVGTTALRFRVRHEGYPMRMSLI